MHKYILINGLVVITIVVIGAFKNYMSKASNHGQVEEFNKCNCITPLYMRYQGYDKGEVVEFYDTLSNEDKNFLQYEKKYQTLDLIFPLVYGCTLIFCIYMYASWLGRLNLLLWLISPVVITMLADWLENSMMLKQLHLYTKGNLSLMSEQAIAIASYATQVKIACLVVSCSVCIYLAIAVIEKHH